MAAGLGAMEVCSSTEMGAPVASHLGTGDHGPKTDRSRPRSVPVNALVATELSTSIDWPETGFGEVKAVFRTGGEQLVPYGLLKAPKQYPVNQ